MYCIGIDVKEHMCFILRSTELFVKCWLILENAEGQKRQIYFENPVIESNNAILDELESLANSIEHNIPAQVSLEDGTRALELAYQIIDAYTK